MAFGRKNGIIGRPAKPGETPNRKGTPKGPRPANPAGDQPASPQH